MSDEIAVKPEQAIAQRPSEKFAAYAKERAALEAPLVAEELGMAQGDAILSATTEEELNAAMETASLIALKDLDDGTEIEIHGFHLAPGTRSEFATNLGVFAVMQCTLIEESRDVSIDTGVERIIKYLRMAEQLELFPVQRRIRKTPTGQGEMITLLPIKKRPVQGQKA
jgi:hypothetical protein